MSELKPRWYQTEAIRATWDYMSRHKDNPCIVIPTGGGKSPTMAMMIKEVLTEWDDTRICVLAHVKELIEQNHDKAMSWWPEAPPDTFGIYSAGLGFRDTDARAVFAGIQSVHKNPLALGRFDLIFVDEAHRIPLSGEGMYRKFILKHKEVNPALRVVGFTATPYRLDAGSVIGPENILNSISFEVSVRNLIEQGFLANLSAKKAIAQPDLSDMHIRGGEYIEEEMTHAMMKNNLVPEQADELLELGENRKSWLLFAASVKHANAFRDALIDRGITTELVTGETKKEDRSAIIKAFHRKEIQALVNVMVLTEGFDAPHIDLIALLRPTKSPGLYYQMVGRGLRLSPDKEDCLIADFAGVIEELGPIDDLKIKEKGQVLQPAPLKTCPECKEYVPISAAVCPVCGYEFPFTPKAAGTADCIIEVSDANILSGPVHDAKPKAPPETYDIDSAEYDYHAPKQEGKNPTLKATYYGSFGQRICSQWLCFEHPPGFARRKAEDWFNLHVSSLWIPEDIPMTIIEILELINDLRDSGEWKQPNKITVDENGKFPEIKKLEFPDAMPAPKPVSVWDGDPGDDVPF